MPSREITGLRDERERLRLEHAAGASGRLVVRALSDSIDRAIASVWMRIDGPPGAAVVALGGYGRREVSPFSDVDLIFLHARNCDVTAAAKALAYELWDAGLELGYALHTPKEALRLSRRRLDSETAFLDARPVVGDDGLFDGWRAAAMRQTARAPRRFVERIRKATLARRASAGDAAAELEPNLKDGRGGLRDLTTIRWLLSVLPAGQSPLPLEELEATAELLHRVRNELHFSTGRRTDVLLMQHQDAVARALFGDSGEVAGEDVLMHSLYRSCRAIAFCLDSLLDPSLPVTLFSSPPPEPWPPEALRDFLEIVSGGHQSTALQALEQSGALFEILPEWKGIHCLPQRNVYHRYAVDVHSLEVTRVLAGLAADGDELTRRVAADSEADWEVLLLAGLLHDIGKGGAEDHALRGEQLARAALARMGVQETRAEDVAWLVRNHLLLSESATRRDIADERLLGLLADQIGSERRLRLLYLLTVADGVATGPAGWSPWKATLVAQLFTTLNHFLEDKDLFGKEAAARAQARAEQLEGALSDYPPEVVRDHISGMPRTWILGHSLEALIEHSKAMIDPPAPDEIRLHAVPQRRSETWEVTVVARDRPGLFSKISGSLSLHGLNILGADVYTRADGVALEVFRLQAMAAEDRRFERVVEDARKALRGRLSLDVRLAQKRKDYSARIPKGKREPPQVVVDNRTSDLYTILDVHATDRVGLLYTITRALAEMELDIHRAKIATYAEDVVDVFYVRDLEGQKLTDPEHTREIERTILHRLATEE